MHRREDFYHGPYLEKAADLLIEWDDYKVVRDALCYRADGRSIIVQAPKRIGPGERWSGTHQPQGIFIACGPHIKQRATVANASIYDIAATTLYLQDHPIPGDMDGKVLTNIFTEERLRDYPAKQGEPASVRARAAEAVLDVKEARKIEERLRDLGYIE